jgi:hypothetical protein
MEHEIDFLRPDGSFTEYIVNAGKYCISGHLVCGEYLYGMEIIAVFKNNIGKRPTNVGSHSHGSSILHCSLMGRFYFTLQLHKMVNIVQIKESLNPIQEVTVGENQ